MSSPSLVKADTSLLYQATRLAASSPQSGVSLPSPARSKEIRETGDYLFSPSDTKPPSQNDNETKNQTAQSVRRMGVARAEYQRKVDEEGTVSPEHEWAVISNGAEPSHEILQALQNIALYLETQGNGKFFNAEKDRWPTLLGFLDSEHSEIRLTIASCVKATVSNQPENKEILLPLSVLPKLMQLAAHDTDKLVRKKIIGTIVTFARNHPESLANVQVLLSENLKLMMAKKFVLPDFVSAMNHMQDVIHTTRALLNEASQKGVEAKPTHKTSNLKQHESENITEAQVPFLVHSPGSLNERCGNASKNEDSSLRSSIAEIEQSSGIKNDGVEEARKLGVASTKEAQNLQRSLDQLAANVQHLGYIFSDVTNSSDLATLWRCQSKLDVFKKLLPEDLQFNIHRSLDCEDMGSLNVLEDTLLASTGLPPKHDVPVNDEMDVDSDTDHEEDAGSEVATLEAESQDSTMADRHLISKSHDEAIPNINRESKEHIEKQHEAEHADSIEPGANLQAETGTEANVAKASIDSTPNRTDTGMSWDEDFTAANEVDADGRPRNTT